METEEQRSSWRRRVVGLATGSAVLVTCLSSSDAAPGPAEKGTHVGVIVASNVYVPPQSFDSIASLKEAMDRLQQPEPINLCCGGAWRMHFVAMLERPLSDDSLDLDFFDVTGVDDVTGLDSPTPRSRVFSSAVAVHPGQTTLFVNDFVVTQEQGFVAGHKYEVSLQRPADPERDVLAKGRFVLK